MTDVAIVVAGYLLGSVPFGYLIPRLVRGEDVRQRGSGNVGASNVWRVYGRSLGVPVALLDVAKGFVPAALGLWLGGDWVGVLAGAAAMVGHARPVFLGFSKGGKMVATAGGAFLGVAPLVGAAGAGVWILVFALTRYSSVASVTAAGSLAFWAWLFGYPWSVIAFGGAAGVAVAFLHRANIARLARGEESRFELRRRRSDATRAASP